MLFFENTRKPVGLGGKFMVAMMNVGHSAVARWGLNAAPFCKAVCGYDLRRRLVRCGHSL